jgi:trk system potassium uptake protein TrkH
MINKVFNSRRFPNPKTGGGADKTEPEIKLLKRIPLFRRLFAAYGVSRIFALSFLVLIIVGGLILSMPISNKASSGDILGHFFTSVSAVCVTGLVPHSVITQYSTFGQTVLLILMQTGGLGLITFAAMFIIFSGKSITISESMAFADVSGQPDYSDVSGYLKKILLYTGIFEGSGFLLLSTRFIQDYGIAKGLFKALFVSVAAFTNAGFDNISEASLAPYSGDLLVNITVMLLITVGGLGFIVWIDLARTTRKLIDIRRTRGYIRHPLARFLRMLSFHTKVIVTVSAILTFSAAVFYFFSELWNTTSPAPGKIGHSILISLFQAVTLRTAGFSTVDLASCRRLTLLIMCIYMLIGGSPGGTAGGMKTTTAAVMFVEFRSILQKKKKHNLFRRRISLNEFRKAFLILTLYLIFLFGGALILSVTENPDINFIYLIYEEFSAIGTVGLTAGVTPLLSVPGRLVIMFLMYAGRIGPLLLIETVRRNDENNSDGHIDYPSANIMIG